MKMKSNSGYIWTEIKVWLLMLWTLPQSIVGLIVILFTCAKPEKEWINNKGYEYSVAKRFNNSWRGVSLGEFIIFAKEDCVNYDSLKHEYGHRVQSNYFGPLYLFIIGLPSILGNLWDRIAHKKWSYKERIEWYYKKLPWERWADILGGVDRFYD